MLLLTGGTHVIAAEVVVNETKAVTAEETAVDPATLPQSWDVAPSIPATHEITLENYLNEVLSVNLGYAAQRYNVDIAKAEADAAHLWSNPALGLAASRDLTFHGKKAVDGSGNAVSQTLSEPRSISLSQPFDISGKRRRRIRTADQTYKAAATNLKDFLRNLRLDAAVAFAEALAANATLEQQRKAVDYMTELVQIQQIRLKTGDISEADYLQSRLEEMQLQNDLKAAEADAVSARIAMCTFLGRESGQTTLIPEGKLNAPLNDYQLDQLITHALAARADLVALRYTRDAAQNAVLLAKAERFDDVELGISYTHNPASTNFDGASPRSNELGISLSAPLPLWNRNQYGISKAQSFFRQTQRQLEAAELKAEVEIRTVLTHYRATLKRIRQFQEELLHNAEVVLATRRKSYQYGEISLLELLEAQRTANDIRKNYNDALADAVKVYIEVQRAAALTETPVFNSTQ